MKDTKKVFTVALLAVLLVFSNILVGKTISFFGFPLAGSILAYPFTFLCVALLNKWYGEKVAIESVFYAIVIQIIVIYISVMTVQLPAFSDNILNTLLLSNLTLLGGSLVAFTAAQYINVKLYNYAINYLPNILAVISSFLIAFIVDATLFMGIFSLNTTSFSDAIMNTGVQIFAFILMMIIIVPVYLGFTKEKKEEKKEEKKVKKTKTAK